MKEINTTMLRPTVIGEQLRGPNDQHGNIPYATARHYCGRALVWYFDNGQWVSELPANYWSPMP